MPNTIAARPTTEKIDDHEKKCSRMPEVRRPITAPPAATPTQVPTAFPRSSGGKTVVITESVTGMIRAAATPRTARIAISVPGESTNSAANEAAPNRASPTASKGFRPKRSPIAPAGRSSAAKTIAYASTIHSSSVCDAPVSRAIPGRATLRLATAATTIIRARHMTRKTAARRCASLLMGDFIAAPI